MATPTIPNGEEYFFPIIYEGNGGGQRVGKFVPFTDNGTIDNSCIFNDGDSAYLDRTFGSGNQKIWTMSFWVKRCTLGTGQRIISRRTGGGSTTATMGFTSSNTFDFYDPSNGGQYITDRTFEDTSKWYHFLIRYEASNATAGDRLQIYVDGDLQTFGTTGSISDANGNFNAAVTHAIGKYQYNNTEYLDGYLAEVNWVDGTNYGPETFGVTDTSTGRWIPKTLSGITYGTNGFRLEFGDSSALGDDTSGNTNDFTATNLASTDQTTDSPTQNFMTLNPNDSNGAPTLSEGNLTITDGGVAQVRGDKFIPQSGKYYFEYKVTSGAGTQLGISKDRNNIAIGSISIQSAGVYQIADNNTSAYINGTTISSQWSGTIGTNNPVGVLVDMDNKQISFQASIGGGSVETIGPYNLTDTELQPWIYVNGDTVEANFGQKSFALTQPTDYVALQQDNLPETAKGISGFSWIKSRDTAYNHISFDSSQGVNVRLLPSATNSAVTAQDTLNKFLKGGFQTGSNATMNTSGDSLVAWNWVANGGTTASNTDGSITSTVQANTTAGFSIVQYTGTGSNATVGHGLSSAPELIILKRLNGVQDWLVGNTASGWTKYLFLNGADALATASTTWNDTAPTSSVFSVGTANSSNKSGDPFIGYVWHGVDGFSKIGSYTGNGSTDGPFIYTGFKPRWIMFKETGNSNDWPIWDSARFPLNPTNNSLFANLTQGDNGSSIDLDVLSNGFKCRTTNSQINRSSGSYIYMAFAEHPFVGDGTSPVTAR